MAEQEESEKGGEEELSSIHAVNNRPFNPGLGRSGVLFCVG